MGRAVFPPCYLPGAKLWWGYEDNGDLLPKVPCTYCYTHCLQPCSRPPPTHTSARDSQTPTGKSRTVSCGVTALSNSVKQRAMPCRATQDGRVMVESSDKLWSAGEGNDKPLQYSCLENPMNSMKRQKDRTGKMNSPGR